MDKLVVPVGRDLEMQEFELETYSDFQRNRITEIVNSDEFVHACHKTSDSTDSTDSGERRKPGKVGFLWYDTADRLRLEVIGVHKVLRSLAVGSNQAFE